MHDKEASKKKPQSTTATWLQVTLIVMLCVAVLIVTATAIMKTQKKAALTTATNNAKSTFYLLVEFESDFGEFPNDQTAQDIKGLGEFRGEYSNDYLSQFIAANYTNSEEVFFTKGNREWKRPDNITSTKEQTLSEGECGFAYIKGLSTKDHPETPILLAPMYGDGYKFNPSPYDKKAVILRIDGSVKQLRLNKDRHAILDEGTTLFDGGADSIWGEGEFNPSSLLYPKSPYTP